MFQNHTEIGDEGYIKLDGEQIDNIGLHVLRRAICIIPQDSFVFTGTLRFNIDPYNEFKDDEIFSALEKYGIFESLKSVGDQEEERSVISHLLQTHVTYLIFVSLIFCQIFKYSNR